MALSYEQRVLRVLQYIHDNPAADLSLDALAEVGMTSRFHWHRVFQALTGETCAQAVRRIRLSLAATVAQWRCGSCRRGHASWISEYPELYARV